MLTLVRTIFIVMAILLSFESDAQIYQHTKRLGPELNYRSSRIEIPHSQSTVIKNEAFLGLAVGYFVVDNLDIGLGLKLYSTRIKFEQDFQTDLSFIIGPYGTYMIRLSDVIYVPVSVSFGYKGLKSSLEYEHGNELSGGIGLEYILDNKLGLRVTLNRKIGLSNQTIPTITDAFTNFIISIGGNIYFPL